MMQGGGKIRSAPRSSVGNPARGCTMRRVALLSLAGGAQRVLSLPGDHFDSPDIPSIIAAKPGSQAHLASPGCGVITSEAAGG